MGTYGFKRRYFYRENGSSSDEVSHPVSMGKTGVYIKGMPAAEGAVWLDERSLGRKLRGMQLLFKRVPLAGLVLVCLGAPGLLAVGGAQPDALADYIRRPDASFSWRKTEARKLKGFDAARLDLVSQTWRDNVWSHQVLVVRPRELRHPGIAFLFITGDGDVEHQLGLLETLASRSGALAAALNRVPNQPLYDGRKEDALIAYTFDQYLKTGDATWPLLFPMVKSAVRAMDAVQAFALDDWNQPVRHFVVSGASKRGWTTWLTAAADPRVEAIAPIVIDMLNMKVQAQWAEAMYGRQSEQIKDYTDLNLIARMDEPRMVELRGFVDPYSYRSRYRLPKLLLLGTNDPYWVVDSLRNYWNALPDPKLVFQTPNAGHDLGGGAEAKQTLAAFFQMVADRQALPEMTWRFETNSPARAAVEVQVSQPAKRFRLWTADSATRDFRQAKWSSQPLLAESPTHVRAEVAKPAQGYRAYLVEAEMTSRGGHTYNLSTEARVIPDGPPAR